MSDFVVRPVEDSELRTALNVFYGAVHYFPPMPDEKWKLLADSFEPRRVLGAFIGQELIGTAASHRSTLAVPGGALPMAAVTWVGVRADHTRRGALTELMRMQLAAAAEAGEALAGLHASEGVIYGRFGYGVATVARAIRVNHKQPPVRPEVPRGGEVRLLDVDQALAVLPQTYAGIAGQRPGMMARSAGWWRMNWEAELRAGQHMLIAAHVGPDGYDGFVVYATREEPREAPLPGVTLRVFDLQAANPLARNDLWRYLLGVDLVDRVHAYRRPLDEPVEAMLVNHRAIHAELDDELWLRLVDVGAALAGRRYGDAEPVVIEVRDPFLPANSGRYLISPQGTEQTSAAPGLTMDVDVLATIYLGATRPSALAEVGRIRVAEPDAPRRADQLFATDVPPWCGTMF